MLVFQIILSAIATALGVIAAAAMGGAINVSPDGISACLAISGVLATYGAQIWKIPPNLARAFGAVSLVIAMALGAHWAFLAALVSRHAWAGTVAHWIGLLGAILGFVARNPVQSRPSDPPSPPAPNPPAPAIR